MVFAFKKFKQMSVNPLSANPTKWSNNLKQFVGNLPTNYLSMFDHFVGLTLKRLIKTTILRLLSRFSKIFEKLASTKLDQLEELGNKFFYL